MIRRVDRYELLEQVGSGGMATVYRAWDTALDREVAIKLLHPHLASRPEARARFSREARAVARLRHPGIVEIYDYAGDDQLESYLVTEFVHGPTLRVFAAEEGVGYPEVGALIVRALADALAHAHAAGIIHRDLKPENVLVLSDDRRRALKLVDFGIARILSSDEAMTVTGALVGSPNHMAPEIIEGLEADARSDVFSLGTILYWLSTGKLPFMAPNPTATMRRVVEGRYDDPRSTSQLVSDDLTAVIAEALAPAPAQRIPSAVALRDALDAALARAGLADPAAELSAFLDEPSRYKDELRGRLVEHAISTAERALMSGETVQAMRLLARARALQPDDAETEERMACIMDAARRRQRLRKVALLGAVLGPLFVIGWVGVVWHELRAGSAQRSAAALARGPRAALPSLPGLRQAGRVIEARAAAPKTESPTQNAPPLRTNAPSLAPPPPRPTAPETGLLKVLSIHVSPYAQRALLDGVEVARGEERVVFSLNAGAPHRIQIEHACCFPFVKEIAPGDSVPAELKERMKPRPARLRVEGDPETRVYVDGAWAGTAGDSQRAPLEIAVPPTGDNIYEAQAELRLELPGRAPVSAMVRLRAGADLTFVAPVPDIPLSASSSEEIP